MSLQKLIKSASNCMDQHDPWGISIETGLPNLYTFGSRQPMVLGCDVYQAVACLILQGRKNIFLGGREINYGEGDSLIVSHDLHVMKSEIVQASQQAPYMALIMTIDQDILRSLYNEIPETEIAEDRALAVDVSKADENFVSCMARYLTLLDDPAAAKVLGPLYLKELHYHLLVAPHGGMLRNLIQPNSHASRISRVISHIRNNYMNRLTVAELAAIAGMSASALHENFKTITQTTPLQYQKELRLIEARRILTGSQTTVSSTAFEVGYESPTQFSREYTRKFGVSPRQDRSPAHLVEA